MTHRRSLIWGLAALAGLSIALNLLLLGGVIGQKAGKGRQMERGLMMQMAGSVPAEVRPHLRSALRERRTELRGAFRDMRAARRGVSEVLAAPQFSEADFAAALLQLRAQSDRAQQVMHAAMIDTATGLSAVERQSWAEQQWRRRRMPSESLAEEDARSDPPGTESAPSDGE